MADIGKVKGHATEAKANARADLLQRREAEAAPGTIILNKNDVQGEYDVTRLLHTTLGGQKRMITSEDMATFRHNIRKVQKNFKRGVTARQVVDLANHHPLPAGTDGMSDLQRARRQIHTGVPASANVSASKTLDVRFITNASRDSDVPRHHVFVRFLEFDKSARDMLTTATDGTRQSSALTPKQAANQIRHGRLAFDCDCGRHRYFLRYIATIGGFNAGRDEHGFPKIRNPGLHGIACKHVLRVMSEIDSSTSVFNFITRAMEKVLASGDNKTRMQHKQEDAEALAEKQAGRKKSILTTADREARNAAERAKRSIVAASKKAPPPKKVAAGTRTAGASDAGKIAALKRLGFNADQIAAIMAIKGK